MMLKYKDLVEKLFTLSLNDSQKQIRLNPSDELPLYAECVERAINESHFNRAQSNNTEYIKLHIEWKSFDGISNLFKDTDYGKADFVHKSVHHLQRFDSENAGQGLSDSSAQSSPASYHSSNVTTARDG